MQTTIDTLKSILAKLKRRPELVTELSDSADLLNEVGLDSLEMLQFMLDVEEHLDIRVDFDKLEFSYLEELQTLAAFLQRMPRRQAADTPS